MKTDDDAKALILAGLVGLGFGAMLGIIVATVVQATEAPIPVDEQHKAAAECVRCHSVLKVQP